MCENIKINKWWATLAHKQAFEICYKRLTYDPLPPPIIPLCNKNAINLKWLHDYKDKKTQNIYPKPCQSWIQKVCQEMVRQIYWYSRHTRERELQGESDRERERDNFLLSFSYPFSLYLPLFISLWLFYQWKYLNFCEHKDGTTANNLIFHSIYLCQAKACEKYVRFILQFYMDLIILF